MDPLVGVEGQVYALRATLQLLLSLLVPCLLFLCFLNCLLLLRWRPPTCQQLRGEARGQGDPVSPQLFQVVSGGGVAVVQPGGNRRGVTRQQLLQPDGPGQPPASPLPPGRSGRAPPVPPSPAALPGPKPRSSDRRRPRGRPSDKSTQATVSSSSDWDKQPILAPPNSPAIASGTADTPGKAFATHVTSTQNKRWSRRSPFPSPSAPFEYGSSIQCDGRRAPRSSANFTASQGPGLDSEFGASAGISVRILSSDSEGGPAAPQPCRQQSGQFEWDYYDPSYKRRARLQRPLPPICSKQYWL